MNEKIALAFDMHDRTLLGKPDVDCGRCSVCGRAASDHHHVIAKGIGGRARDIERMIPTILLCGWGNAGGCHGLAHSHALHFAWDESRGGWVYWISPMAMSDFEAWDRNSGEFRPLPGWEAMQREVR